MKKLLCVVMALIVLAALCCPLMTANAVSELMVEVEPVQANAGDTVTVEITVTENVGVSYLSVTLSYDKSVLELVGVSNGSVIKDLDKGANLTWSGDYDSTATGTLATLTFKVADDASAGLYELALIGRECYNESYDDVPYSITMGTIEIR